MQTKRNLELAGEEAMSVVRSAMRAVSAKVLKLRLLVAPLDFKIENIKVVTICPFFNPKFKYIRFKTLPPFLVS